MNRIKARELALMLLPVLALAGMGWWLAYGRSNSSGEFRLVVDEAKLKLATPRESFLGFDSKIVVRCHTIGEIPVIPNARYAGSQWRCVDQLLIRRGGKEFPLQYPRGARGHHRTHYSPSLKDGTGTEIKMSLSTLPQTSDEIIVRGYVQANLFYVVQQRGGAKRNQQIDTRADQFSVTIRKANQTFTPAPVSRYCPLTLLSARIDNSIAVAANGNDTGVVVIIQCQEKMQDTPRVSFLKPTLVDETGKHYTNFKNAGGSINEWYPIDAYKNGIIKRNFEFPLGQVPQSAGAVRFETFVSVNDCWPLKISVPVRAKK